MTKERNKNIGTLIVRYANAKWGTPDAALAEDLGAKLGREMQLRLDVLGLDGEHLLNVPPEDALRVLNELEREAEIENFQTAVRTDPFEDGAIVRQTRPQGAGRHGARGASARKKRSVRRGR